MSMMKNIENIFTSPEDQKYKSANQLIDSKDIRTKTIINRNDVVYLTKIEMLAVVIKRIFEFDIAYLKDYCDLYRINNISVKGMSRNQFIDALKSIAGMEQLERKAFTKKMLGF